MNQHRLNWKEILIVRMVVNSYRIHQDPPGSSSFFSLDSRYSCPFCSYSSFISLLLTLDLVAVGSGSALCMSCWFLKEPDNMAEHHLTLLAFHISQY